MRRPRQHGIMVVVAMGVAFCRGGPPTEPIDAVRLSPVSWSSTPLDGLSSRLTEGLPALIDRDTTTGSGVLHPARLRAKLAVPARVVAVKVFGLQSVRIEAGGRAFERAREARDGWARLVFDPQGPVEAFELDLVPLGPEARVAEIELWGQGVPLAPRDPASMVALQDLARFEHLVRVDASPATAELKVGADHPCAQFSFKLDRNPRDVRRAFLLYRGPHLKRPIVLSRSLNGHPWAGGFWMGTTAAPRDVMDELNPRQLESGNHVKLCLPDRLGEAGAAESSRAAASVTVEAVQLVAELDDGTNLLDRDSQALAAEAWDRSPSTSLGVRELELGLLATTELDRAWIVLDRHTAQLRSADVKHRGDYTAVVENEEVGPGLAVLLAPGNSDEDASPRRAEGVRLRFAAPSRGDLPGARLAELGFAGSPVGRFGGLARIVVTYPTDREHFGDTAYVAGFVDGDLALRGMTEVSIDGEALPGGATFSKPMRRKTDEGPWTIEIQARLADGSVIRKTVVLDNDRRMDLAGDEAGADPGAQSEDLLYGAPDEIASRLIGPEGGQVKLGQRVRLDAPAGAVDQPTSLSIQRRRPTSVPRLDPGMVNVTAPEGAAYRFLPPGQKFKQKVRIHLPYDPDLLPASIPPEEVRTYYYVESLDRWDPLARLAVHRADQTVESETDHLTFMINAVLVLPEHPGPVSFNPNSIKDLKAADPSAGIDLIEPPQGNSQGTARLAYPIRLPRGRGAYEPDVRLVYDSSAPNGWLGVGWDVPVSKVEVDTRFGVPFYDGEERYLLDGEQLVPVTKGTCVDGTEGRLYAVRVERDFRRIVRCGADTRSFRFEVTDKSGTLFLYGVDDPSGMVAANSRLVSYRPGAAHIAQWHLERVIDANDNLTQFFYHEDRNASPGTAFDQRQGEGFRQLYPRMIRYTGRGTRQGAGALSGGTPGPYLVEILPEVGQSAFFERSDVITSARMGFKVVTRHRLGRIQVWFDTTTEHDLIREYRFSYETGDFGKSRLKKIEVFGAGGIAAATQFYSHDLSYTNARDFATSQLSSPVAWPFVNAAGAAAPDKRAISSSVDTSLGVHVYVGVGPTPLRSGGSAGLRIGFTHREGSTEGQLLDINGDGLPDRVTRDGVVFNRDRSVPGLSPPIAPSLSAIAPPWDPLGGRALTAFGPFALLPLGRETGDAFNIAFQANFLASLSIGLSSYCSVSREFLLDADGDGLIDVVVPGKVLLSQPRSDAPGSPCSADQFCFREEKQVEVLEAAGGLLGQDRDLAQIEDDVSEAFHPTDAMLEWTAPFEGKVKVEGSLKLKHTQPQNPRRDGVRLRVYQEGTKLAELTRQSHDGSAAPLAIADLPVLYGQRLYFVLSTIKDFPVDVSDPAKPVPLEEVDFAPVVTYTECTGFCGPSTPDDPALFEPTGAKVFTFDAAKDFKVAGDPFTAVRAPRAGSLRIVSFWRKKPSADDVRLCIQRFAGLANVEPRSCARTAAANTDVFYKTLDASDDKIETHEVVLRVSAGDSFSFRVDTDFAMDPDALDWVIFGEMTSLCDAQGVCRATTDKEKETLRFDADPYFPLHTRVDAKPLRPLIVRQDGELDIDSSGFVVGVPGFPVFFGARQIAKLPSGEAFGKLLFKHESLQGKQVTALPVKAGDQILFEVHSEEAFLASWNLSVHLKIPGPDGGTLTIPLQAPQHHTSDRLLGLPGPLSPGQSPFGGGFHGWRYGVWGGKETDPFDPTKFKAADAAEWKDKSPKELEARSRERFRDPDSEESRRARRIAPLVPRRAGTRFTLDAPGLRPDRRTYVSQDGNTFIGPGLMHGARKGGFAAAGGRASQVQAAFDIGDVMRTSVGQSFSGGIGIGFLNLNVSAGTSTQKMDVLDMNGDRIIDVAVTGSGAAPAKVRLTHQHTLRSRPAAQEVQFPAGAKLRENQELTTSIGLGVSGPVAYLTARGETRASRGMYPTVGGGIGVTVATGTQEMVDVNGDGLMDHVRREGDDFRVRLNLGTAFAEEDRLPVGTWAPEPAGASFDPFVSKVNDQLPPEPPPDVKEDPDTKKGRKGTTSAASFAGSADVLRRSTATTVQVNLGFADPAESFGVSANLESSLGHTQVALVDVTGDGLPDYVRKATRDENFRVKVNRGYGFGPEEVWQAFDWSLAGAARPTFRIPFLTATPPVAAPILSALLGQFGVDGVEATGTHSKLPSVGFVVTIPILIGPLTPWLHLSGGIDFSPQRVSGFELGFMDINGDGFLDHVLKTDEDRLTPKNQEAVYARVNQLARGNLLKEVSRPLGSKFSLVYERVGNTVDMPESRFVLTRVLVQEGVGSGTGHDFTTDYLYAGGRFDRSEREFLGFESMLRVNPDFSRVTQRFDNRDFAHKGLLLSEETRDLGKTLYTATISTYEVPQVVAGPVAGSPAQDPAFVACEGRTPFFLAPLNYCRAFFVPLKRVERRFYEATTFDVDAPGIVSAQQFAYDPLTGNVKEFEDLGDVADTSDDHHAKVAYADDATAKRLYYVGNPTRIEVSAGRLASPGRLLRLRVGEYGDGRGNLTKLTSTIDGNVKAVAELEWLPEGNLKELTGPPNDIGEKYALSYTYDTMRDLLSKFSK